MSQISLSVGPFNCCFKLRTFCFSDSRELTGGPTWRPRPRGASVWWRKAAGHPPNMRCTNLLTKLGCSFRCRWCVKSLNRLEPLKTSCWHKGYDLSDCHDVDCLRHIMLDLPVLQSCRKFKWRLRMCPSSTPDLTAPIALGKSARNLDRGSS